MVLQWWLPRCRGVLRRLGLSDHHTAARGAGAHGNDCARQVLGTTVPQAHPCPLGDDCCCVRVGDGVGPCLSLGPAPRHSVRRVVHLKLPTTVPQGQLFRGCAPPASTPLVAGGRGALLPPVPAAPDARAPSFSGAPPASRAGAARCDCIGRGARHRLASAGRAPRRDGRSTRRSPAELGLPQHGDPCGRHPHWGRTCHRVVAVATTRAGCGAGALGAGRRARAPRDGGCGRGLSRAVERVGVPLPWWAHGRFSAQRDRDRCIGPSWRLRHARTVRQPGDGGHRTSLVRPVHLALADLCRAPRGSVHPGTARHRHPGHGVGVRALLPLRRNPCAHRLVVVAAASTGGPHDGRLGTRPIRSRGGARGGAGTRGRRSRRGCRSGRGHGDHR
ncbi:unannotated protein [freshwater metagenome]|uniref:Unannotated protein n=1 Tax=freshwater metagenome TaxID=449393 RepID=A0A6J7EWY1_9ZZZZ